MAKKRVVCISDLHCGHLVGITPPGWGDLQKEKMGRIRRECWIAYRRIVKSLLPIDVLIVNGDMIEGKGERSSGTELITSDREEQARMAAHCIDIWGADKIVATRGTPYHTGVGEEWENIALQFCETGQSLHKIGDHEFCEVNGVVFDVKHHTGSSSVPHGRKTAVSKDQLWNMLWAIDDMQPAADWVVRSHVHYSEGWYRINKSDMSWAITTPALQAMGSKYGKKRCSGKVDWGVVVWDVDSSGGVEWQVKSKQILSQKATVTCL